MTNELTVPPPTPEQAQEIIAGLVESVERALVVTRHLLWAVMVLAAGNVALVCSVIVLMRR